ncbi:MAG: nucleotidyl transferase AbiEii/AbiGii toxin family protein [Thermoplasmatales archaeon]|nr:nucleotidyl transferase AbiEii/AbiGii toxin family protein [Thermoplasmatales archaeon]MCW6169651.1 nucleotidyl transferase AbiEii/AbiGii toxin family protein [Thermoplasmatales archaeon]
MIDVGDLLKQSGRFRDARQLEKDYLLTLLLFEIYRVFDYKLIFKGGTSLKYFYNLNRFSEDLDFSYIGENSSVERGKINRKFEVAIESVGKQYVIKRMEHRGRKENGTVVGINFELRVQGPLYEDSRQMQNVSVDISLRGDVLLESENKYMLPSYQDIPLFLVPVMNLEEIAAEKVASIMERDKIRDIYDLYFLLFLKKVKYNEPLVIQKMSRRLEKFDRNKLREKIHIASSLMKWNSELSYLVNPLPDNLSVVRTLEEIIGLN